MDARVGAVVMITHATPYPRYGRVLRMQDAEHVRVTQVQCGDPRCAAEHTHADAVWAVAAITAAHGYQPRASWEEGRKSSPNAPVFGSACTRSTESPTTRAGAA